MTYTIVFFGKAPYSKNTDNEYEYECDYEYESDFEYENEGDFGKDLGRDCKGKPLRNPFNESSCQHSRFVHRTFPLTFPSICCLLRLT